MQARAKGDNDFDKFVRDGVKMWKPKDGLNTVRVLPPTFVQEEGKEHWGLDLKVHYGVGPDRQSYLCSHKMRSEACPLCEERAEAQRAGDDQFAKELDSKTRVLIYLVDRDAESEGIQAYAMPQGLDRDLVKVVVDARTGEVLPIDDPYHGYDVSFTKSGQGIKTKYEGVQIARRESPLANDAALKFAMENPLDTILEFFSYGHILAEFGGGAAPATGGDASVEGAVTPGRGGRAVAQEPQNNLPEVTWEYVNGLTSQELDALCAEMPELAEINPAQAKDDQDLIAWICEVLKLSESAAAPPPPPAVTRRGAVATPAPAADAPLTRMRITRR